MTPEQYNQIKELNLDLHFKACFQGWLPAISQSTKDTLNAIASSLGIKEVHNACTSCWITLFKQIAKHYKEYTPPPPVDERNSCIYCGKKIELSTRGVQKYCSRQCYYNYRSLTLEERKQWKPKKELNEEKK